MNKREITEELRLVAFAKRCGILALKLNLMGNTGWPDRQFLHEGRSVFVEMKRRGEDLRRNQPERIDDLVRRRFHVGVFDDANIAARFLEATLLSESWRKIDDPAGVCWIALQARSWKDLGGVCGVPYLVGQTVRKEDSRYLSD